MMTSEPTTLEYSTPQVAPRRLFSVTAFLASAMIVAVLSVDLVYIVPRCEAVLLDYKARVSVWTDMMFLVGRWFSRGGWAMLISIPPALGFLVARITSTTTSVRERRVRRLLWALLVITFIAGISIITSLAMLLPMFQLLNAMSGK